MQPHVPQGQTLPTAAAPPAALPGGSAATAGAAAAAALAPGMRVDNMQELQLQTQQQCYTMQPPQQPAAGSLQLAGMLLAALSTAAPSTAGFAASRPPPARLHNAGGGIHPGCGPNSGCCNPTSVLPPEWLALAQPAGSQLAAAQAAASELNERAVDVAATAAALGTQRRMAPMTEPLAAAQQPAGAPPLALVHSAGAPAAPDPTAAPPLAVPPAQQPGARPPTAGQLPLFVEAVFAGGKYWYSPQEIAAAGYYWITPRFVFNPAISREELEQRLVAAGVLGRGPHDVPLERLMNPFLWPAVPMLDRAVLQHQAALKQSAPQQAAPPYGGMQPAVDPLFAAASAAATASGGAPLAEQLPEAPAGAGSSRGEYSKSHSGKRCRTFPDKLHGKASCCKCGNSLDKTLKVETGAGPNAPKIGKGAVVCSVCNKIYCERCISKLGIDFESLFMMVNLSDPRQSRQAEWSCPCHAEGERPPARTRVAAAPQTGFTQGAGNRALGQMHKAAKAAAAAAAPADGPERVPAAVPAAARARAEAAFRRDLEAAKADFAAGKVQNIPVTHFSMILPAWTSSADGGGRFVAADVAKPATCPVLVQMTGQDGYRCDTCRGSSSRPAEACKLATCAHVMLCRELQLLTWHYGELDGRMFVVHITFICQPYCANRSRT